MTAPLRRHRFEPARLVLGLGLIAVAAVFLLRTAGAVHVTLPLLLSLLPAALLTAAAVAVAVQAGRRVSRKDGGCGRPGAR